MSGLAGLIVFFALMGLTLLLLVASIVSKRFELVFAAIGMLFLQSTIQGLVSGEDVPIN